MIAKQGGVDILIRGDVEGSLKEVHLKDETPE